tara:strand:- start:144 stop:638 length:495 start_codon:yes stop_codon:yes gene_type:complete
MVAGVVVAVISLIFKFTTPNLLLLGTLGSSAAILTHQYVHRLTILRTVIFSYSIALVVSLILSDLGQKIAIPFPTAAFLAVSITTLLMYLFNVFHPPAVSASLSFFMLHGSIGETIIIFISVIILLILVKLLTYAFYYGNVEMEHFLKEFKKYEHKAINKLEGK